MDLNAKKQESEKPNKVSGLFGGQKPVNQPNPAVDELNNELASLSRRIRMLEERYYNIRKKTQLTDQNMIEDNRKVNSQLKHFTGIVTELKRKIADIEEKLKIFDAELNNTPKKNELTVIKKYLDFWEPIKFMTEKEATKLIEDYLDKVGLVKK